MTEPPLNPRPLQIVLALLSILPIVLGGTGMLAGAETFMKDGVTPNAQGHMRFLFIWYMGMSVLLWWIIPRIRTREAGAVLAIMCVMVCLGGLSRFWSFVEYGAPDTLSYIVWGIEIAVILLIPWQRSIARS